MKNKFLFMFIICMTFCVYANAEEYKYADAPVLDTSGSSYYTTVSDVINNWKIEQRITSALNQRGEVINQVKNCTRAVSMNWITSAEYDKLADALYWWLNKVADEGSQLTSAGSRQGWNIHGINIGSTHFQSGDLCVWRLVNENVPIVSQSSSGVVVPKNVTLVIIVADYVYSDDDTPTSTPLMQSTIYNDGCTRAPVLFQTNDTGELIFFGKSNKSIVVRGEKTWGKAATHNEVIARQTQKNSNCGQLVFVKSGSLLSTYTTFKNNYPSDALKSSKCILTNWNGDNKVIGAAVGMTGTIGYGCFYHVGINDNVLRSDFGGGFGLLSVDAINGDHGIFFNECEFNGNMVIGPSDRNGHGGGAAIYFNGNDSNCSISFRNTTFTNNCQYSDGEKHGGGIFYADDSNGRSCTIDGCTFKENYAHGATGGGGAISNEGKIIIKNSMFDGNIADNSFGGAIYTRPVLTPGLSSTKSIDLTINNCIFRNNSCTWTGNSTMKEAEVLSANIERGSGGAILIDVFRNTADPTTTKYDCNLNLENNCVFENNHADRNGGAVAIVMLSTMKEFIKTHASQVKSDLSLKSTSFSGNTTGADYSWLPAESNYNQGGALYLLYTSLDLNDASVSFVDNYATFNSGKGGAMSIYGGSLSINGGSIGSTTKGNSAQAGGGAYINGGSLTINSGHVLNNISTVGDAGAVMVDGGNVKITNGTVSGNIAAKNGGAFCLSGATLEISNGTITDNTSNGNGGAIKATNCKVDITGGMLSKNKALINGSDSGYGGAIFVASNDNTKTFTISGGQISNNKSYRSGGGVCVSGGVVNISAGVVNNNEAEEDGGGFYANGGSITFNGTTSEFGKVTNNTARNGGGLFLSNGAVMNITGSLITNNKAVIMGGSLPSTAYHGVASSGETLQGLGGGVYLAAGADASHKTTLSFAGSKQIGLYNNTAEVGADEILACGNNTSIYIPAVADMDLSGFSGKAANWYEDYLVNDTAYGNNSLTDVVRTKGKTALRYKDALSSAAVYSANISNAETKYICIALGIQYAKLIIKKQGLKTGESAIFTLNNGTATRRLVLTGIDDSGSEVQAVLTKLETGTWTVTEETGWSWAYTAKTASQNVDFTGSTTEKTLTFVNTAKENTPKHAEAIKENKFKDKAGSISGMTNKETTW